MLSIQSLSGVQIGSTVQVELRQTDQAGGINFTLVYDPAVLEFVEWISGPDLPMPTLPINPVPGAYKWVCQNVETGLPELLGWFRFKVNGPSSLTFQDVTIGTKLGEPIPVTIQNGEITIEDTMPIVTKTIEWDDPNSPPLNDYVLRMSQDSADPASGTWTDVATVAVNSASHDFTSDTGIFNFYVVGRFSHWLFGSGETGPSNILTVDTALPLPMGNLRIV